MKNFNVTGLADGMKKKMAVEPEVESVEEVTVDEPVVEEIIAVENIVEPLSEESDLESADAQKESRPEEEITEEVETVDVHTSAYDVEHSAAVEDVEFTKEFVETKKEKIVKRKTGMVGKIITCLMVLIIGVAIFFCAEMLSGEYLGLSGLQKDIFNAVKFAFATFVEALLLSYAFVEMSKEEK